MSKSKIFKEVKITNDRKNKTYTGIRLRPAADKSGYYVQSLENHLESAFITEGTYQKILAGEYVNIHV